MKIEKNKEKREKKNTERHERSLSDAERDRDRE